MIMYTILRIITTLHDNHDIISSNNTNDDNEHTINNNDIHNDNTRNHISNTNNT